MVSQLVGRFRIVFPTMTEVGEARMRSAIASINKSDLCSYIQSARNYVVLEYPDNRKGEVLTFLRKLTDYNHLFQEEGLDYIVPEKVYDQTKN